MLLWLLASCSPPTAWTAAGPGPVGHAADTGAAVDTAPPEPPDQPPTAAPQRLRINEVQTRNDATVMAAPGVFPDWVELVNADARPVDLTRARLWADGDALPALSGELAPGAVHLVLLDPDGPGLSGDGERIELRLGDAVVDRIATGRLPTDTAFARFPDGGAWQVTARPTPGWTNGSAPPTSADPSDRLFDEVTLHRFELGVSEADLRSLEADRSTEVPADLQAGPAWFPAVGARLKGQHGSRRELDEKCAWKLDLNEYVGHSLHAQEVLTLNNMVQDPSYLAEHLTYQVYRAAGVPAPRTAWAWLTLNGEDLGLYAVVETVDEHLLARWFADPSGRMWEGKYGQDFVDGDVDELDFERGPDDDRANLYGVAEVLSGPADDAGIAALERRVDLDEWLTNQAVEALTRHWDGYTTSNNYRLYEDPVSGRLSILPWGVDQTLRELRYGPYEGRGDVMQFCLRNAGCAARYDQALLDVADLMDALPLEEELDRHLALLAEPIAADPRRESTESGHNEAVEAMRETIRTWPDAVRARVAER